EAGVFETLSVREHFELFARLKGLSKKAAREAAAQTIHELDLDAETGKRVGALSGGLRRRILIGLALLGRPPLLVLDEPTTGLDPASRRAVWRVLRQAVGKGASVMLSTHYMEEAEQLSDQIAIISDGRVIAFGSLRELLGLVRDSYRLTYHTPDSSEAQVHRFPTFADARAHVERHRLSEYSVARASLEDVYFEP